MFDNDLKIKLTNFFNNYKISLFNRKEVIFRAEESLTNIFFLKSGFVRVYRLSEDGEELTLTILKPYEFFPFSFGTIQPTGSFYLEALTSTEIWKVPQLHFLQFLKENPNIYYELTNSIFIRFERLLTRMDQLITGRASAKVATTLLACAELFGETKNGHTIVNLPLTHKDIAALIGITRETTCLEMKKLARNGAISYSGRILVIEDQKKLEEESIQNIAL